MFLKLLMMEYFIKNKNKTKCFYLNVLQNKIKTFAMYKFISLAHFISFNQRKVHIIKKNVKFN